MKTTDLFQSILLFALFLCGLTACNDSQQLLFFINQGKYYKEDELRYKHFEVDIVGMKWNIYTSTIYYKRLQVTFTATLSRPDSDTKKVLKGKFMQRYPYDCSEIHHEVKDSLED